ncbi:MAG: signal transduction protein [Gemmatimonadetes bacterium]|nr:signal transduction protein [Gemmatimonadota bacterium]
MPALETTAEARRSMEICNACRYCEGFCAVFPAMELRRAFSDGDLNYLANLCHGCRGCFYACQYAPPHEFGINLPKILSELRAETYVEYAWPRPMGALFRRNGTVVSLVTAGGIALVLLLATWLQTPGVLFESHLGAGAFYRIIPQWAMTGVALATFFYAVLAIGIGAVRFWRDTGGGKATGVRALAKAASDALTLRNLGGGGHGCNDRDESFSQARRLHHHCMFYGFLLCLASTTSAAIYDHFLHRAAPYPFFSLPVLLGTAGGVGMVIGTFGLIWLKVVGDPEPTARKLWGGEYALLAQLFLAALTGLLLLALRDSSAMGVLLAVHLGVILSFFVTMPYSKFVHGIYRSAALLRNAQERQVAARADYGGH